MSIINKEISDFKANAFHENEFKTVTKEDILGKWSVFFFYPADFTFICPTELEDLANKYEEFRNIGCEIYSVSTDTHFVHKAWHDASLTDKLTVTVAEKNHTESQAPCVKVFLSDATDTGLAFHGVPSGHEFTSFVLGLYNASGPGQKTDELTGREIKDIKNSVDMKILVSLSCTMCPDLVIACQRIATLNPNIRAEVYDLQHFDELKKKYNVMSVPCLVINDDKVSFGKKNINQVLDLIKESRV